MSAWIKERMRLWILAWAKLIDGLLGVLTLSFWYPGLAMKAALSLARWRYRADHTEQGGDDGEYGN